MLLFQSRVKVHFQLTQKGQRKHEYIKENKDVENVDYYLKLAK